MPAKSKAQQRLMGMVHAFKKGKLKRAPKKVRDVAKHISDDDARDFARTSHDDLPEKKASFDFEGIMSRLDKMAAGTPVVVYVEDRPNEFHSIQEAAAFIAGKGSIPVDKVKEMLGERQQLINGMRVEYPDVLPSEADEKQQSGIADLASMFRGITGAYGPSSYGM